MFIDLIDLLVNYFGDSSDSDDFIPSMVEKDDDPDIDMVIESTAEGMLFSCSTFFSKSFITDRGKIENLLTLVTLPTCPATYP